MTPVPPTQDSLSCLLLHEFSVLSPKVPWGLELKDLEIGMHTSWPILTLLCYGNRHSMVGRGSEIAQGGLTTIVIPALSMSYRLQKLWICMEFCGAGSLQDIYQGQKDKGT